MFHSDERIAPSSGGLIKPHTILLFSAGWGSGPGIGTISTENNGESRTQPRKLVAVTDYCHPVVAMMDFLCRGAVESVNFKLKRCKMEREERENV